MSTNGELFSNRIIEGSPKNSVTAVAIQPWIQAATLATYQFYVDNLSIDIDR